MARLPKNPSTMDKRVVLWGINYSPEVVGIAVYTTELAEFLQQSGVDVSVVTAFPYYPHWRLQDRPPLFASDRVNGVAVERCLLYVPSKPNTIKRILHELSFAVASSLRLLFLPAPCVYFVISPPLILGLCAAILCLLKGGRYIFHVQDLQPDASAALGMIGKGPFYSCLKVLERLAYRNAALVTCISEQMRQKIIQEKISEKKVVVFPNWIAPPARAAGWREHLGLKSDIFVVSYSGNLGFKQGLDSVIEAARLLCQRADIVFVIGGSGSQKQALMRLANEYNLKNVIFQDLLDDHMHTAMLCQTDVFVMPQKPGSGAIFFPSKLLKALSLGCPIVTNADSASSLHEATVKGEFGVIVPPGDAAAFAVAIEQLCDAPELRQQYGQKGIEYAQTFRADLVLPRFFDLLSCIDISPK